ncbi:MAG TPA: divalent-cation tolerance protein CutA [Deltaproteobacteria bacterium]|nr:divalent-cation tolerance protein CutA [Deltaproteobacteria bacterium]
MKANIVYMTAGSKDEARTIGKALVEGKLAACVNIIEPMHSIYMWEGELQEDTEVVLIAKTTEGRVQELIDTVRSLHSYDCPCVLAVPVRTGNQAFLDWIRESVDY